MFPSWKKRLLFVLGGFLVAIPLLAVASQSPWAVTIPSITIDFEPFVKTVTAPYRFLALVKQSIEEQGDEFSQKTLAILRSPYVLTNAVKEGIDLVEVKLPQQLASLFESNESRIKNRELGIKNNELGNRERIVEVKLQQPSVIARSEATKQSQIQDTKYQILNTTKEIIREIVVKDQSSEVRLPKIESQSGEVGLQSKLTALKDELNQSFADRLNKFSGPFGFSTNRFDDLFVQKSLELAGKLTQPASVASSPVTFSSSITSKDISATALSLSSTLTVSGTATSTISGPLKIAGGLTAGSGNIQIIDSTGKIPALSSTYFASLPNIFSSIGNASSTVQFSASQFQDTLSFEGVGGTTISFDSTNKKITFSSTSPTLLNVLNQGADASSFSGTTKLGGILEVSTIATASGNLTLNPSGTIQFFNASSTVTNSGNITIAGTLTINSSATSTLSGPLIASRFSDNTLTITGGAIGGATTGVFSTSLTTPLILTSSGNLALQPTTGVITLNTASKDSELRIYENAASPTNYTSFLHGLISTSSGNIRIASASNIILFGATSTSPTFKSNLAETSGNDTAFIFDTGSLGTAGTDIAYQFRINTSPKLTIDKNGNVGIGTTTPSAPLEVEGNAKFTRSTVGTSRVTVEAGNDAAAKLLLHMDGTNGSTIFTDSSASVHAPTANGNAQISTAQSQFGGASGLFDGTGDFLSITDSEDFTYPGDFTIDFWMRTATNNGTIWHQGGSTGGYIIAVGLNVALGGLDNKVKCNGGIMIQSTTSVTDNNWHHVACVKSGNTIKLYVDGIEEASGTTSETVNEANNPELGRYDTDTTRDYNGNIDEFRISKGIARWTANFTVPSAAHTGDIDLAVGGDVTIGGVLKVVNPGARVFNSANISISSGVETALTFNSERYDNGNLHSTVSNTSRLTATTAGKYVISASVQWPANSTGIRGIDIRLNGATFIARLKFTAASSDLQTVTTIYYLTVNDYVEAVVTQNSGGALNAEAISNNSPEFAMQWLGE